MQKLHLFDETFDQDQTESYETSIQVTLDGFSLCIRDLTRNLFVALIAQPFPTPIASAEDWHDHIPYIQTIFPWIAKKFKRVIFSYVLSPYILVPTTFYNPNKAKALLSSAFDLDDCCEIRFHHVNNDTTTIFGTPSQLITAWLQIQPNSTVIAPSSPLIKSSSLQSDSATSNSILLSINGDVGHIVTQSHNRLLHSGTLPTSDENNVTYYLLNICNSLELNPADTQITIVGEYEKMPELDGLIKRFFKGIAPFDALPRNQFAYLLGKYRDHFATLFSHSLCA